MADVNKVILIGNLTRDPELKYTSTGTALAEFGMAINRKYKDQDETTFVDITVWGKLAELASQYLSKGRPVYIEGRLKLDQWTSPEGQKRSKLSVVGETMQFLGGGRNESQGGYQAEPTYNGPSEQDGDDPPF